MDPSKKHGSIVAKRLREAREALGISQHEVGVRAGMDPSVASPRVNQYERGKHSPDLATLGRVAKVLGRPVAYFYALDDLLAAMIVAFDSATPAVKRRLMAQLKPKED